MTIQIIDKWSGGEITHDKEPYGSTATMQWHIFGAKTEALAISALLSGVGTDVIDEYGNPFLGIFNQSHPDPEDPSTAFLSSYFGVPFKSCSVTSIDAPDGWLATVSYSQEEPSGGDNPCGPTTTPSSRMTFTTMGGNSKMYNSIKTIRGYDTNGTAHEDPISGMLDFNGAINVNGTGPELEVRGVDLVVPKYGFTIQQYYYTSDIDLSFRRTVRAMTGSVNSSSFDSWSAGEVLYLGATGSRMSEQQMTNVFGWFRTNLASGWTGSKPFWATSGNQKDVHESEFPWNITHHFAVSPNNDGSSEDFLNFKGKCTAVEKKGWEYAWVRYMQVRMNIDGSVSNPNDEKPKGMIRYPAQVYVEQIYPIKDFDSLDIDLNYDT